MVKVGNRIIKWGSIAVFYLLTVLLHVKVGGLINGLFSSVSRASYNNIITAVVLIIFSAVSYFLYKNIRGKEVPKMIWLILAYTVLAILSCFSLFFVIHIEAVHFLQYAILAFLLRGVMPSYLSVAVFSTLLGAYDELYQYMVLDTRANYFDFNDIFLDAVGTGIGLLCYWFLKEPEVLMKQQKSWRRIEWIALVLTILGLIIMAVVGELTINLNESDPALFTLFKIAPEGFWHYPTGPYARFHILRPIPGFLLIVSTVYIYGRLDKAKVVS